MSRSDRGQTGPERPSAPVARREPTARSIHGVDLVDQYAWLRERDSAEVLAHLHAENAFVETALGHLDRLRQALYDEMLGRIKEDDSSVPVRRGPFYYHSRTFRGGAYPIHCRRHGGPEAPEQVILDVNQLAEGSAFFRVGSIAVSPDHRLLAFSADTRGDESFTVAVKDLETGELLADRIVEVAAPLVWAEDNRTLFYVRQDETRRPYRVYRHRLGTAAADDPLVFEEADQRFFVSIGRTRSRRFLTISCASKRSSETWIREAQAPEGDFRLFRRRRENVEYSLTHHGEGFFVRTNDGAKNFRLLRAPESGADPWDEIVPHRSEVKLEGVLALRDHLVLVERADGLERLRVIELPGGGDHQIELPEPVYAISVGANPEFDTSELRFSYTSLVTPETVYDYDLRERRLELRKQQEVLGGYDSQRYETRREIARSADGTSVPISLVHRRDLRRDGDNPCLLYAYGSYGISIDPSFSSLNLTLLERGFVYAIAHVRGGGELGEAWHEGGRMLDKANTFQDFIAAAEHLFAAGYTEPRRLAIKGGSAGGLLVGAVLNMRPDLCRAAIANVPFVDVANTMLDPDLPLTITEYEEWGDPRDETYFRTILSYSPYDNVSPQRYPALLVTAGLNDPRVQYWEPAKWVARLRAEKLGDEPVYLKTNMGAGHSGPTGRYAFLEERAFEVAFLLDALGLDDAQRSG